MNRKILNKINSSLINWYTSNRRYFPWRNNGVSLYEILLSEILLRKTSANMVMKFYLNFIKRYPNLNKIRESSLNDLEKDLTPLGLNNLRALTLKKIADEIHITYNDEIPDQYNNLIKLYGIGRYIANAILCFGLNRDVILVDTNINRIFSRLFNKKYPYRIDNNHPLHADLNLYANFKEKKLFFMALIDFGALVCKKRNLTCKKCPLLNICKYENKVF